jgi:hypothetical protein
VVTIENYNLNMFIVQATVAKIVYNDHWMFKVLATEAKLVNYNLNMFIVQATVATIIMYDLICLKYRPKLLQS